MATQGNDATADPIVNAAKYDDVNAITSSNDHRQHDNDKLKHRASTITKPERPHHLQR